MKVWIAIGGWSYEGFDEPIGIYSSRELAEKAKQQRSKDYDAIQVIEYEIDRDRPA